MNIAFSQLTTNESFDIPATKVLICVDENEPSMVPTIEMLKSYLETAD